MSRSFLVFVTLLFCTACNKGNDPCQRPTDPISLDVAERLEGFNTMEQVSQIEGNRSIAWALFSEPISLTIAVGEPGAVAEAEVDGCDRAIIIRAESEAAAAASDLLEGSFSGSVYFNSDGPTFGLDAERISVGPFLADLLEDAGHTPTDYASFDASLEGGVHAGELSILAVSDDGSSDTALTGAWSTAD